MSGDNKTTSESKTEYSPEYNAQLAAATAKANEVANQPFSQYEGQRTADLSPDTIRAMEIARGTVGSQNGVYDQAGQLLNQAGAYNPVDTATQLLQQYGRPDDYSGLDTANPALGRAADYLDASSADYTNNVLNSTGANQRFASSVDDYMSPYTSKVVDEIARRGNQNLTELLPNVNKTFIGGGVFGGSQNKDLVGRTIRDAQSTILGEQARALESGYSEAGQLFNQDQNRLSGQASTLGNLAAADYSRASTGYQNIGKTQADLGNQDADRRTESTKYLTGLGTQDQTSKENLAGLLQQYGSNYNKANLQDAAILEGIGSTQQQQEQAQINSDIQKYLEQKNYGKEQLETLSYPLQTFKFPSTTTQTNTQSSDPFGQILGAVVSGASAYAGAPKKEGGSVRNPLAYASGGGVQTGAAIGHLLKKIFGPDTAFGGADNGGITAGIADPEFGYMGQDGVKGADGIAQQGIFGQIGNMLSRPAIDTGAYNPVGPQAFDVPVDDFLKKLKFADGGSTNPLAYADGGSLGDLEEVIRKARLNGLLPSDGSPITLGENLPSLVAENTNPVAMGRAVDENSPDSAFNANDVMQDPAAQNAVGMLPQNAAASLPIPKRRNPLAPEEQAALNAAMESDLPEDQKFKPKTANPLAAPVAAAPNELEQYKARIKELTDSKDDKFRSQLLRLGIGLMSPGSFGTQLQQGFKGYADAGDAYDAQRLKGYNDLTGNTLREGELNRKSTNDQLDNLIAEQRIAARGTGTGSDKGDTERMKQRVKYISDSAVLGKDADAAAAEFDSKIWPSGGAALPERNIAKSIEASSQDDVKNAPSGAIIIVNGKKYRKP